MRSTDNPNTENSQDHSDSDPINDKTYNKPTLLSLYYDNVITQAYNCGFLVAGFPFCSGFLAGSVFTFPLLMAAGIMNNKEWFITPGCIVGTVIGVPTFALGSALGAAFIAPFSTIAAYHRHFTPDSEMESVKNLLALTDTLDRQRIIDTITKKYKPGSFPSYESQELIRNFKDENIIASYTLEERWQRLTAYMTDKTYTDAYTNNGKSLFNIIVDIAKSNPTIKRINLQNALQNKKISPKNLDFDLLSRVDLIGMNYLHRAVMSNDLTAIETLKKTKLLNSLTQPKKIKPVTALNLAVNLGRTEIAIALINANATFDDNIVMLAVKKNRLDILKALHKKQPRTLQDNLTDVNGKNILHIAAENGHMNIVQYLIDQGMDIHNKTYNKKNRSQTPSRLALHSGHPEVAKAIDIGIDQIRRQFKILFHLVNAPEWQERGFQLFSANKKPDGIEWILERLQHIRHSDDIDKMTPASLVNLANEFWRHDFGIGIWRNKETQNLYDFANNLGKNEGLPAKSLREEPQKYSLNY